MKPILAISMGDPAGIGAEIIVKSLARQGAYDRFKCLVVGDKACIEDAIAFCNCNLSIHCVENVDAVGDQDGIIYLYDLGLFEPNEWEYKKVSAPTGEASYRYIEKATEFVTSGDAHAIVTGPINKEAINMAGYHFAGHTEILAHLTNCPSVAMMLTTPSLRVIHVTTHVSMRNACDKIKTQRVLNVIRLADESVRLMGISAPKIGVAGLNAHSSENGLFGWEEEKEIIPAIEQARKEGYDVTGPVPPDTVFVKALSGMFDVVVAMYHDQGHIPVKLSGFKLDPETNRYTSMSGVNTSVGLPIIRTSVDHGTAFGKAGEGRANEESMIDSLELAATMAINKLSKQSG